MLDLRKFEPADIDRLRLDAVDDSLLARPIWCKQWAKTNAEEGPAYTAIVGNKVVGSAGVRLFNNHAGIVWAVFSTDLKTNIRQTLRSIRRMLAILIDENNLRVLYATSRKGFAGSQHLLEHLGFTRMAKETKIHYQYKLEI